MNFVQRFFDVALHGREINFSFWTTPDIYKITDELVF